jgi:hypothetical protein
VANAEYRNGQEAQSCRVVLTYSAVMPAVLPRRVARLVQPDRHHRFTMFDVLWSWLVRTVRLHHAQVLVRYIASASQASISALERKYGVGSLTYRAGTQWPAA